MYRRFLFATLAASTLLAGCATPLNTSQKMELDGYRAKNMEVVEKNPKTGTYLGFLPGGGSFYTRNYGLGVVNLLFWPISILWDPISGRNGAESINYYATKDLLDQRRTQDMKALEAKLASKQITTEAYLMEKSRIETKYAPQL